MQQDYYSFNPMNPLAAMSPMAMNAMGMQQQMPFYGAYGNNYFAAAAAAAMAQQQQQQQPIGMHPFANYPIGHTLPTQQRSATVAADRMRKSKQKFASSEAAVSSSARRFEDVSNSTDESIHLVRSRKNGETAPIRYVDVEPKRRTQSGNSIMKSSQGEIDVVVASSSSSAASSNQKSQKQRSQSGDRCDSPIGSQGGVPSQQQLSSSSAAIPEHHQQDQQGESVSVKSGGVKNASSTTSSNIPSQQQQINNKKKKEKKQPQQSSKSMNNSTATSHNRLFNFADSVEHVYMQSSAMQYPQMQHGFSAPNYSGAGCYQDPWGQQQQPQVAPEYMIQQQQQSAYPQNAIVIEAPQQQQQSQGYYGGGYGSAGYDAAPGGPGQCQPQCQPQCAPQQQQQPQQQEVAISVAYQQPAQQQQQQPFFVDQQQGGYGADQSCGQYGGGYDQAPAQTIGNCPPSLPPCLPPGAKLVAEYFLGYLDEQPQQQQCSNSQQSCNHQNQCYYPQSQSSSESSKEDVDIEVWEKQRGSGGGDTRGSYSDYEDNGYQSGNYGYPGYSGSNAYSNGYANGSNAYGNNGSNAFSSAGYANGSNGYANGSNAFAGSNGYAGSNAYPGYPNYNNNGCYSGYPNGGGDYNNCNNNQGYPNYSDQSGCGVNDPYGQQQQSACSDPNCNAHGSTGFNNDNYEQPSASTAYGGGPSSNSVGGCVGSPSDDIQRMKDDIIKAIQNELGNMKLQDGAKSDPIQPIFLMPKGSGENKPIYIPRNIYVPVIRPVFVPRERIIVRPQIIHVARPVLVDRPVPIQQRPIVIERDRPVPVRVETIEKTEPCGGDSNSDQCNEVTKNIENGQEVTYHEFTQTFPANAADYSYQDPEDVVHEHLQSKSNDDLFKYHQHENSCGGNQSKLESVLGNSQGYTLEVLDQRISDKFEKTDTETIKARYGVESYQYLPPSSDNNNTSSNSQNNLIRESSTSALSTAKRSAAEFYSSTNAAPVASKNSNNDTGSVAKTSSSNIYNFDSSTAFAAGSISPRN